MNDLDMLTAREQLMKEIDLIVGGWWIDTYQHYKLPNSQLDYLIRTLCDAVCENFPTQK